MPDLANRGVVEQASDKTYITRKELEDRFPTLERIIQDCPQGKGSTWGLCQKETTFAFRFPGDGWVLQRSLDSLLKRADELYAQPRQFPYAPKNVYVMYGIAYDAKNPSANDAMCEVYHLPSRKNIYRPRHSPKKLLH